MDNLITVQMTTTAKAPATACISNSSGKGGTSFANIAQAEMAKALDAEEGTRKAKYGSDSLMAMLLSVLLPPAVLAQAQVGTDNTQSIQSRSIPGEIPLNNANSPIVINNGQAAQAAVQLAKAFGLSDDDAVRLANLLESLPQGSGQAANLLANKITQMPQDAAATQPQPADSVQPLQAASQQNQPGAIAQIKQLFTQIINAEQADSSPLAAVTSEQSSLLQNVDAEVVLQIRQLFKQVSFIENATVQPQLADIPVAKLAPATFIAGNPQQTEPLAAKGEQPAVTLQTQPGDMGLALTQGGLDKGRSAGEALDNGSKKQDGTADGQPQEFMVIGSAKAAQAQETQGKRVDSLPQTVPEAFERMVDNITAMRKNGLSEMEIHLKPDFLGNVVIKLAMEGGSLVAKIVASNPQVQDAFQNQAQSLQNTLMSQGLKDVSVLVTHNAMAQSDLQQQTARQSRNSHEQQNRRNYDGIDIAEKLTATQAVLAYEEAWRTGTINYLA